MTSACGDAVPPAPPLPDLGAAPAFALAERSGRPVTHKDLEGRVWIAGFIFTRCAGPCPRLTAQMARLQRDLPPRDDLRLVAFTVDPEYDSPAVLAAYADNFRADRDRWLFLTGPKAAVRSLILEGFRLSVADAAAGSGTPPGDAITHSTRLVLVDRHGRMRGYYDSADDAAMTELMRDAMTLTGEITNPNPQIQTYPQDQPLKQDPGESQEHR